MKAANSPAASTRVRLLLVAATLLCCGVSTSAAVFSSRAFESELGHIRKQVGQEAATTQRLLASLDDADLAELRIPARALLSAGPVYGASSSGEGGATRRSALGEVESLLRSLPAAAARESRKVETLDDMDDFDLTRLRRIPRRAMQAVTSIYGGEGRRLSGVYGGGEGRRSLVGVYGGEGRRLSGIYGGEGRRSLVGVYGGEGRMLSGIYGGEGRRSLVGVYGGEN